MSKCNVAGKAGLPRPLGPPSAASVAIPAPRPFTRASLPRPQRAALRGVGSHSGAAAFHAFIHRPGRGRRVPSAPPPRPLQIPATVAAVRDPVDHRRGRRNLQPFQRVELALKLEPLVREKAKEQQKRKPKSVCQNSDKQSPIDTKKELAKEAGVSHDTIAKARRHLEPWEWGQAFKRLLEAKGVKRGRGGDRRSKETVSVDTAKQLAADLGVDDRTARNRMKAADEYEAASTTAAAVDADRRAKEYTRWQGREAGRGFPWPRRAGPPRAAWPLPGRAPDYTSGARPIAGGTSPPRESVLEQRRGRRCSNKCNAASRECRETNNPGAIFISPPGLIWPRGWFPTLIERSVCDGDL